MGLYGRKRETEFDLLIDTFVRTLSVRQKSPETGCRTIFDLVQTYLSLKFVHSLYL